MSHDGGSFVEFEVTGTFTHINYYCGEKLPTQDIPPPVNPEDLEEKPPPQPPKEKAKQEEPQQNPEENPEEPEDDRPLYDKILDEYKQNHPEDDQFGQGLMNVLSPNPDSEIEAERFLSDAQQEPDVPETYEELDDDEKAAVNVINEYPNDEKAQKENTYNEMRKLHPDEDWELSETRAEFALDTAKKFV